MNVNILHNTDINLILENFLKKSTTDDFKEHIFYTLYLSDVSRALLQELVRHQHLTSFSVKSSRYTLKELKQEESFIKL